MSRCRDGCHRLIELFGQLPRADVEMIQFSFVDRMGHVFGVRGEVEQACYDLVDELIVALIESAQPDSTMIISDHGFQGDGHTDYGCLAVAGQLADAVTVAEGYTPSGLDVAPTLAGFCGASHACEGNDLTADRQYVTRDGAEEEQEKQKMMENLRDLGYL